MNTRWVRLALIVSILITTPSYGDEQGQSPILIYQQQYAQSPVGVYTQGEWLFVIAEQEKGDGSQPAMHYEGKTMLQTQALLKRYVLQQTDFLALKQHGFKGRLGVDVNELILSGDFYDFSLNAVEVKVLENKSDKMHHRRVTALKVTELSQAKLNLLSQNHIEHLLRYLFTQAESKSNNALLARYYFDLGLLREAYFYKWQQLSKDYYLVNYPALDAAPFQARQLLRQVLTTEAKNYNLDWLQQLPANPELFAQIKENIGGLDRIGQSLLDVLLLPALTNEKQAVVWHRSKQALSFIEPNKAVQSELDFFQASREALQSETLNSELLSEVLNQQGFLIIEEKYSAESNSYFQQAKILFDQGKSIDKVAELLRKSIQKSPRHAGSWVYYGSVLKYQKHYHQALAAFQQASLLNHSGIVNQANIADIYLQLKQTAIAKPYLYYLQQLSTENVSAYTKKVITNLQQIKD